MKRVPLWKKYILKTRYFDSKKESLKGSLLSLMLLVSIILMSIDISGSLKSDFVSMVWVESLLMIFYIFIYVLFPKFISLEKAIMLFAGLIISFILLSLTLPGYNQEFVLFALAMVPASIFFLLGLERGIRWSVVITLLISLSMLNAFMQWVTPIFDADLLLEVNIAYVIVSYYYYMLEKERLSHEHQLEESIKEKSVLLQEIHHRAKNNLQMVMGLFESQAMRAEDQNCKKLLRSQRGRLQSMSLLHQHLAHDANYEKVNMSEYLTQIVKNLQKTTNHILDVKIENFRLDMSKGINLGLLLNEAVSNAIEHAYPKESIGKIEINLKRRLNHCRLSVKDYGKKFDATAKHSSLGLVLMEDIVHFFPEGVLVFDFEIGTEVIMEFYLEEEKTC